MNFLWPVLVITALTVSLTTSSTEETLLAGLSGAASSVEVLLSFAGIMAFWSGMLRVCSTSGASEALRKLLSPIVNRLFPDTKSRTDITMNIIANLFGMGNAATPAGLSAMSKMEEENETPELPSRNMSRFVVLNTQSLQIIPTTVVGLLAAAGDTAPFSIIPFVLINSAVSLCAALFAEQLFCKRRRKK